MRFPLRLIAKIAKARFARRRRSAPSDPLIYRVDPAEVLHPDSIHPVSHQKIRDIVSSRSPVVWIGGSEPLEHPGIAHLVRAIALSGHFIFLETDGTFLRPRIHEFQPLAQVFLVVRLDSSAGPGSSDSRRPASFELALQGIRAARLSGFFTAVHSIVREDSDIAELKRLREFLSESDVDGWLITAVTAGDAVLQKANEARKLIPNAQWRRFSEDVERKLLSETMPGGLRQAPVTEKPAAKACDEGVKVA